MHTIYKYGLFLFFTLACLTTLGQEIVKIADINLRSNGVNETLPFDRPIVLKYATREPIDIEYIGLVKIKKNDIKEYYNTLFSSQGVFRNGNADFPSEELTTKTSIGTDANNKYELNIYLPPLSPNKFYDIVILRRPFDAEAAKFEELFEIYYNNSLKINQAFNNKLNEINELQKPFKHIIIDGPDIGRLDTQSFIDFYANDPVLSTYFNQMSGVSDSVVNKIRAKIREYICHYHFQSGPEDLFVFGQSLSVTTTSLNFDTRTTFSLTPDFGYVFYGFQKDFHGIAPYIGMQIEFRYFDKNVPFWLIHKNILHYLSFTTGLTLLSLKKEGKREDFFSGKSLLAGIGFRLTNAIRITAGGILFNKENPNPYVDNKKLGITPFAGISIDLKIKSLVNDFSGLISTNKK
jgi:hypothetical protein